MCGLWSIVSNWMVYFWTYAHPLYCPSDLQTCGFYSCGRSDCTGGWMGKLKTVYWCIQPTLCCPLDTLLGQMGILRRWVKRNHLAPTVKSGGAQHGVASNICLRVLKLIIISVLQVSIHLFFNSFKFVVISANPGKNLTFLNCHKGS